MPAAERRLAQAVRHCGHADLMNHASVWGEAVSNPDMVTVLLAVLALTLTGCDRSKEDNRRTPMGTHDFEEDIIKTSQG